MRLILVSLLALGACSAEQVQKAQDTNAKVLAQVVTVTQAACKVDAQAQPVIVALGAPVVTAVAPSAAPAVAGAVALDVTVVHPDIVAACAAIGGIPVAATVVPVAASK